MSPLNLTVPAAASKYGLTPRQLRALIARGALPVIRLPGARGMLLAVADLEALFKPTVAAPKARKKRESESAKIRRQLREAGIAAPAAPDPAP